MVTVAEGVVGEVDIVGGEVVKTVVDVIVLVESGEAELVVADDSGAVGVAATGVDGIAGTARVGVGGGWRCGGFLRVITASGTGAACCGGVTTSVVLVEGLMFAEILVLLAGLGVTLVLGVAVAGPVISVIILPTHLTKQEHILIIEDWMLTMAVLMMLSHSDRSCSSFAQSLMATLPSGLWRVNCREGLSGSTLYTECARQLSNSNKAFNFS